MRDPYGASDFDIYTAQSLHTRQQARLLVASKARSSEDCLDLLHALDLIDANAAGITRRCPRCGTPHERWGNSARSRFCSGGCADMQPDGA
ncbi:hypothetical protein [Streptacidiphilus jiangxiensis]|uniref:Uncharacterized protein n=1 Tax=Streptacidiphilus jiangxiensis TaxID=235985 RepID=A0A1H7ZY35_STRJI|nr:hypothetical protein [Streptacidiphilus jiangxiensis]SEM62634.1 hypothetical protein SAMN05414137_13846 [Streptacidiphilus jiangxiensis]